ncbi:MAG: hypothetical protein AAF840_10700, partial [Bacteroidota bacterium]
MKENCFFGTWAFLCCFLIVSTGYGQGLISSDGGSVTIDWDMTTPGITNGTFAAPAANGLQASPVIGGLDSDGIHIQDDENSATLAMDGFDDPN